MSNFVSDICCIVHLVSKIKFLSFFLSFLSVVVGTDPSGCINTWVVHAHS